MPSSLLTSQHVGGTSFYRFLFTSNSSTDLGPLFRLPAHGTVTRIKVVSDTGTISPRLLSEQGDASTAAGAPEELAQVPGDAALTIDETVYLPYANPGSQARLHLQGTGSGRTVEVELYIRSDGWRS